ncbi:ABC transporter permease [Segetibacter koreensis]|uniref:ABC transporter permease n=1 Tax=Segetibacter koreensis TaxID=398037 RepID=UPI000380076D|nr:FtsX-like permease family protein [Segetibacter koreensis]
MIFIMAWRNIWRNKVRSIVIMLSVAIGLFAGIGMLALYKGMLRSRVRTVIDAETGHIQIHNPEFKKDFHPAYVLPNSNELLKSIRSFSGVKLAAPRSIVQGMLVTTTGSSGVTINGVVPELEYKLSKLKEKLIEGEGFHTDKKNEVIIGKKLADKMKLHLNSKLVLTFTDTADNIVSGAFRVSSIYQSNNAPLDEVNVYVPLETLNELLLTGNSFHEVAILLNNDDDLQMVQNQLKTKYSFLLIETWKDISPETELMVKTIDDYSYIILIIILFALAFGIINTMLMSVLERTKEIGMMEALGTSRKRIFLLILLETIFLTVAGTPLGLLVAYFLINYYQTAGIDLSGMGKEMMASFGYSTTIYPSFPSEKLGGVLLLIVSTAIVSCILPAMKALRLQPVEALRR